MPSSGSTTSRSASMTSSTSWDTVSLAVVSSAVVSAVFSTAVVSSAIVFLQCPRGRVLPRHPGKQRALDAGRVLRHAGERHGVLEQVLVRLALPLGLHQLEEGVADPHRLSDRLADHEV